jgi:hypothetical protein
MTWTKLSDVFYDDPALLVLPRGARLMSVEALVWCNKHGTDGAIPAAALSRFTDEPDALAAAEQLVAAGLWSRTDTGFVVVDFLVDQESAAEVEERRVASAFRQRRSRLHKGGDHSLCLRGYCPNGALSREESQAMSRGDSRPPVPTRPDPTPREGRVRGDGASAPASAYAPRALPRPRIVSS